MTPVDNQWPFVVLWCKAFSRSSYLRKFGNSDLTCNHEHVVLNTGLTCDLQREQLMMCGMVDFLQLLFSEV